MVRSNRTLSLDLEIRWPALPIWVLGWVLLIRLDGWLNLGNLALLLVLFSAIAGMWLSALASMAISGMSVLMFNWLLVEPRHTFHVLQDQDLLLLITMLVVSAVVSFLMARWRWAAELESQHARYSDELRHWAEQFREASDMPTQAELLHNALTPLHSGAIGIGLLEDDAHKEEGLTIIRGQVNEPDRPGLWACIQQFDALGPGTGRFENQSTLFLPLRGRSKAMGVAVFSQFQAAMVPRQTREHMQQLCDALGLEIERAHTLRQAQAAQAQAQSHRLRNTLLTAISHDYRTPLANLMGAASSIRDQSTRLSAEKVTALAQTVLDEAQHLNRMTHNTLQLAKLDASPLSIRKDWESLEEILGSVLAKTRQRFPARSIHTRLPTALPLVLCDAILLVQLLDNLLENAIQYSPSGSTIEIEVLINTQTLDILVMDEGAGIEDVWKDKVFEAFERVHVQADSSDQSQIRRGMGVGLAVCKAIAKVHDASLSLQDRHPHGTVVSLGLPLSNQPLAHWTEA